MLSKWSELLSATNSSHTIFILVQVYQLISRRRFQQMEVLEGQNILVTISGKKNRVRVYYLSWLKSKILRTDGLSDVCIPPHLIYKHVYYTNTPSTIFICLIGDFL